MYETLFDPKYISPYEYAFLGILVGAIVFLLLFVFWLYKYVDKPQDKSQFDDMEDF